MRLPHVLGIVLLSLAIGVCVFLGTVGWFAVGFGIMTGCTNDYSCSTTGCSPCATTGRWINVGGITQWVLAAAGVATLVRGVRARRSSTLLIAGVLVLTASLAVVVGTTWAASESYCRPGTPGYDSSYCSTSA